MKIIIPILSLALFLNPVNVIAQEKAEKQISFAREIKPHTYYVRQAELWWKKLEKNKKSEDNWYNYFRACRNAQGSADWRTDFVNESPYLKTGDDIVALMNKNIPGTFTYLYLCYLNQGVVPTHGPELLKAYAMNPDFEGIQSSVITYAESISDTALRIRANKDWYPRNFISPQLLNYAYNTLMSMEEKAVLFTQHDNDTYPLWMLQDAKGLGKDIIVVNIDMLLLEDYRNNVFKKLNLPRMDLEVKSINDYHLNWQKVVGHILRNYQSKERSLYIGLTLFNELYKEFEQNLIISGLTFKYCETKEDLTYLNKQLYEKYFLLDYLDHYFATDVNQGNVDYQNLNYFSCFKQVYDDYIEHEKYGKANEIKSRMYRLAQRVGNKEYVQMLDQEF